jgi:hypothetical protein
VIDVAGLISLIGATGAISAISAIGAITANADLAGYLAAACPSCPPALEARSMVLSDTLVTNASYAVLPFLVTAFVVRWFVRRVDRHRDGGPR